VFVRLINSTRTRCYQIKLFSSSDSSSSDEDDDADDDALERLKTMVETREGIPREMQSFLALEKDFTMEEKEDQDDDDRKGGKGTRETSTKRRRRTTSSSPVTKTTKRRRRQPQRRRIKLEENQTYQLFLRKGLRGGKGGFGTLLRSTGKKKGRNVEPNNDMCRDLKGQRYHVSENARKMEKWTREESVREEEALALKYIEEQTGEKARKRAKMEKEEERFRKDSEEVKERMEEAMKVATTSKTTVEKGRVRDEEEEEDDSDDEEDEDDFRRKKKKKTTKKSTEEEEIEEEEEEGKEEGKEEERKVIKVAKANDKKEIFAGAAPMSSNSSPPKQENFEPIDLHDINAAQELERFGLDHLKIELTRQNLKCGGSLEERANRLFLLKMTPFEAIDKKHKAMKKK